MPPPYIPVKYSALPATAGAEFSWRPAAAAAVAAAAAAPGPSFDGRAAKLAAAAELARRCAALGVRPPLPPREAPQQHPAPQQQPPAAPSPDRLDALAQQLAQQGGQLASAVTQQSQQLAAQQRLLQDVVQGLLFVGAKASRGGPAAGSAAGTQGPALAAPAPPGPTQPAPAGRPPRPPARQAAPPSQPGAPESSSGAQVGSPERRRAALAAHLRQQAGDVARSSGSDEHFEAEWAAGVKELPCGLLRVPAPPPPTRGALGGLGRRGADLVRPPPNPIPAPAGRGQGAAQQGLSSHRPAWDDRTAAPGPPQGWRGGAAEGAASPVPTRLAGGLAPQLLLAELQRLQRRRSGGGGTARRSLQAPLQQANRPLAVPHGMPGPRAGTGGQLPQAKAAAAAAPAKTVPPHHGKQAVQEAAPDPAQAPSSKLSGSAQLPTAGPGDAHVAGGQRAGAHAKQRAPSKPQQAATKPAPLDLTALNPAVDPAEQPLPEMSDSQMDALCDALLREMLLEECAPAARLVPCLPL